MTDYVLNRASLAHCYSNTASAQTELAALLRALANLDADADKLPNLRSFSEPWRIPLVRLPEEVLSLGEIAHSLYSAGEHEVASYFDALYSMSPIDGDLDDAEIDVLIRLSPENPAADHGECYARAVEASSDATFCALINGLLISLVREDYWDIDHLAFSAENSEYLVDHISDLRHVASVRERRLDALRLSLRPKELWQQRARAFPHLRFGTDVEAQLRFFDGGLVPLLFRRLSDLDRRAAIWQESGDFPEVLPGITPESSGTMTRYPSSRDFHGPDGQIATYEDHIWIDSLHRIHLRKVYSQRVIEIGYVGRHLPTIKYPT